MREVGEKCRAGSADLGAFCHDWRNDVYVRWRSRERRTPAHRIGRFAYGNPTDRHWSAVLVESRRIAGKREQIHIACLGGITESASQSVHALCQFWAKVTQRLDALGLPPYLREPIEEAIARKVGRPSKGDYDAFCSAREAWRASGGVSQLVARQQKLRKPVVHEAHVQSEKSDTLGTVLRRMAEFLRFANQHSPNSA
jgi:hypothetical protein